MVQAWAAMEPKQKLERYEYDAGPIGPEEVEVEVETCGICHSDLSVVNNEWGISTFPAVPGHEIIGRIVASDSMWALAGVRRAACIARNAWPETAIFAPRTWQLLLGTMADLPIASGPIDNGSFHFPRGWTPKMPDRCSVAGRPSSRPSTNMTSARHTVSAWLALAALDTLDSSLPRPGAAR